MSTVVFSSRSRTEAKIPSFLNHLLNFKHDAIVHFFIPSLYGNESYCLLHLAEVDTCSDGDQHQHHGDRVETTLRQVFRSLGRVRFLCTWL